jgi:serine protease Do
MRKNKQMSDTADNHTDDEKITRNTESTSSQNEQDSTSGGGNSSQDSGMYSYVNPKLQKGNSTDGNNPWDSSTGGNYWHYSSEPENSGNTSGGGQTFGNGQYGGGSGGSYGGNGRYGNGPYNGTPGNGGSYGSSSYGNGHYGGPYGNGSSGSNMPQKKKNKNRKTGRGRKAAKVLLSAVVFGAVAGLVMYAVYSVAYHIRPVGSSATAQTSSSSDAGAASSTAAGTGEQIETVQADSSQDNLDTSASGSTSESNLTVAEVADACMPSMVTIGTVSVQEMQDFFGGTQQYEVQGAGTGVIIGQSDSELLIATNNHVIEGATQVTVGFIDESAISGTVKGTDSADDLAVVAVSMDDIPESTKSQIRVITIGDSDSLVLGEQVVAIGNALGYGQSVTSGYVSALDRTLELQDGETTFTSTDLIQTDAAINSGNSGGALLNMQGELIGINEARSAYSSSGMTVDNVGYAIPTAKAQPILDELMNQETRELVDEDERGYLGASFADVTEEYSEVYNMPTGVCITSVIEGGPADEAGLKRGDVVTGLDGMGVSTYSSLSNRLNYYKAGETVKVTYQRSVNGSYEEQEAEVVLTNADEIEQLQQ